ncbi:hypothetical protein ACVWW5_007373 [Bradyrhizobium sp. LM3.4]
MVAAVADLAVEMSCHVANLLFQIEARFAQKWPDAQARLGHSRPRPPQRHSSSTISGGTPTRSGMMLQPRPPEMMTSHFSRT